MLRHFLLIGGTIFILASPGAGQDTEQERRREEEKRRSLEITETKVLREEMVPLRKIAPERKFFAELIHQKVTFYREGCESIVVLAGLEKKYPDFLSQNKFLIREGIIPRKLASRLGEDTPLRKGLLAYMLCRTLGIKGGLKARILGLKPRFALEELAFKGIMSEGNVRELVSGKELVVALTQAASYKLESAKPKR